MNADWISRGLLGAVVVCLLALLVRSWGAADAVPCSDDARYSITGFAAGAPVLVRTDPDTGEILKFALEGGPDTWVARGSGDDVALPTQPANPVPDPAPNVTPAVADPTAFLVAVQNPALPADMRAWSALQLAGSEEPAARAALIDALDDDVPEVSVAALQALIGVDHPRVRAAAQERLEHEEDGVREVARRVLESLER
ncbi:MAG: HEAT repeat domain-containing protein [Myxococcota bacterium]